MADLADGSLEGDEMLQAVTDAMVALHERYHGRKPGTAHTQLMGDDMLACRRRVHGTGGGLGLCVLHEPHAGYGHGEDEHTSYEQQRRHVESRRRAA